MDKKKMQKMMKAMKNAHPSMEQIQMLGDLSEKYKDKNEEEIIKEMKKIKEDMKKDPVKFKQQMKAIEQLKVMLDAEQRKKLEVILKHLED